MALSARAMHLVAELTHGTPRLGDLKQRGKALKHDHELALELWSTGEYAPRLLATLIFDAKRLSEHLIDQLAADMLQHGIEERTQWADWLLANQLTKTRKLAALVATWEHNPSPVLRRLFWYHQARLRWTGQTPPANSAALLDSLEHAMAHAEPDVQVGHELLRRSDRRSRARVSRPVYPTWRSGGTLQGGACCQELYAVLPSGVYQDRSRQACMTPNGTPGA